MRATGKLPCPTYSVARPLPVQSIREPIPTRAIRAGQNCLPDGVRLSHRAPAGRGGRGRRARRRFAGHGRARLREYAAGHASTRCCTTRARCGAACAERCSSRTCPTAAITSTRDEAVRNAVRFVKEAGAEAVKVEGGERRMELIARLVEAEIPVMGHIGLTPQSVHALGGFRVQGKTVRSGGATAARRARRGSGGRVFDRAGIDPARTGRARSRASCAFPRSASAPARNAMAKFWCCTI